MDMFGNLESGIYKCTLRSLNEEEYKCERLRREFESAKAEKSLSPEDTHKLEETITKMETDIKKCRNGYDFSRCENCTNEYYLTGRSVKCCDNPPVKHKIIVSR